MKWSLTLAFILTSFARIAAAQEAAMPPMQMGDASMQPKGDTGPSSQAFNSAMMKMDQRMVVTYTGNADKDFVAGMIPHHQGAIDMAKVELRYGKDPALRKLAQTIIAAQQREIAVMKNWQTQRAK